MQVLSRLHGHRLWKLGLRRNQLSSSRLGRRPARDLDRWCRLQQGSLEILLAAASLDGKLFSSLTELALASLINLKRSDIRLKASLIITMTSSERLQTIAGEAL